MSGGLIARGDSLDTGALEGVGEGVASGDSAVRARLEDQISQQAQGQQGQRRFKQVKVRQIVLAAVAPAASAPPRASPYVTVPNFESPLAERVEGLVCRGHAAWASHREPAAERIGGKG